MAWLLIVIKIENPYFYMLGVGTFAQAVAFSTATMLTIVPVWVFKSIA
jgi:hypothetical protein